METEFTPFSAMLGGGLIGLASVLLMVFQGRILGATGILLGFFSPDNLSDWSWRALILAGMVTAPGLYLFSTGGWPTIQVPVTLPMLIGGGFLVGIGATLGSGCTSGHGVCGMARLSKRSIVATLIFMTVTTLTVYFVRHVPGA